MESLFHEMASISADISLKKEKFSSESSRFHGSFIIFSREKRNNIGDKINGPVKASGAVDNRQEMARLHFNFDALYLCKFNACCDFVEFRTRAGWQKVFKIYRFLSCIPVSMHPFQSNF